MSGDLVRKVLLASMGLGSLGALSCSSPPRPSYVEEAPARSIADRVASYLQAGDTSNAVRYVQNYDDRKGATISYLRAITIVADAGPPDSTNFMPYIKAGEHFETFFDILAQNPKHITDVQSDIPDTLHQLPIYTNGKKGMRRFVSNPGKLWWWHFLSEDDQKKTKSNCYAILAAMEIVEGDYDNAARALKLGRPHFLPGRHDKIKKALQDWNTTVVYDYSKLPVADPARPKLECLMHSIDKMLEAMKTPDAKATLVIDSQK